MESVAVLEGLALQLARLGHFEEAVSAIQRIEKTDQRVRALARLRPHLPKPLRQQAQELPRRVSLLAESGCPDEAIGAALETEDEVVRTETLTTLVPRLAELGYLEEAMVAVLEIERAEARAEALVKLVPQLPASLVHEALWEALAAAFEARAGRRSWEKANYLKELALQIAEAGHPEWVLPLIQDIKRESWGGMALSSLISRLAKLGYLDEALTAPRNRGSIRKGAGHRKSRTQWLSGSRALRSAED